jgi:hypothetical protein
MSPGLIRSQSIITVGQVPNGEPTPQGNIVFDTRPNGAQDLQAITTNAQMLAYMRAGGVDGDWSDADHGTVNIDTNYDGLGTHAMRFDWFGPYPNQDATVTTGTTFSPPLPRLYCTAIRHLGKTPTGGGLGSVGSFIPVHDASVGGGQGGGSKCWLWPRFTGGQNLDRLYWVWSIQTPGTNSNNISIDFRNFDVFFGADLGIGQDVRWTFRMIPASTDLAADGIIQVWRNGVLVLDDRTALIRATPFNGFQIVQTRHDILQPESEYWTRMICWDPGS